MTNPPASLTYSSAVDRYVVRIAFALSDINDIDIWACGIGNAYINEKYREKIWAKSSTDFGNEKEKVVKVIRALYGLKSSGTVWRAMMSETLLDLDYKNSRSDMYVWMNPETNKQTGKEYHAFVLIWMGSSPRRPLFLHSISFE